MDTGNAECRILTAECLLIGEVLIADSLLLNRRLLQHSAFNTQHLEESSRQYCPHRLRQPATIVPGDFTAPELAADNLTGGWHFSKLERLLVLCEVPIEDVLRRPGRIENGDVDGAADGLAHLTHRFSGGEMPHPASLGEQVRHEND